MPRAETRAADIPRYVIQRAATAASRVDVVGVASRAALDVQYDRVGRHMTFNQHAQDERKLVSTKESQMFPQTVIAAVDFSAVTAAVCEKAFELATASGGQVHFVHALSLSELSESTLRAGGVLHDARSTAERELRKLAEPYLESGRVGEVIVREGDPSTVLSQVAAQLDADLIMVDSHHSGLERFVHGSVAESLLRSAPCSVLVVRTSNQDHQA